MRGSTWLLRVGALCATLGGSAVRLAAADDCGAGPSRDFPQGLAQYKGEYTSETLGYAVAFPEPLIGYANDKELGIDLTAKAPGYLYVGGDWNSSDIPSARAEAVSEQAWARKQGKKLLKVQVSDTKLDGLVAARSELRYTCNGTAQVYVDDSIVALDPSRQIVFRLRLQTTEQDYAERKGILAAIVKSWHLVKKDAK